MSHAGLPAFINEDSRVTISSAKIASLLSMLKTWKGHLGQTEAFRLSKRDQKAASVSSVSGMKAHWFESNKCVLFKVVKLIFH